MEYSLNIPHPRHDDFDLHVMYHISLILRVFSLLVSAKQILSSWSIDLAVAWCQLLGEVTS